MSENTPITQKEKMLVSVLVRLYSKETLEKEIQDLEQSKQGLIEQLNAGHEDFQILGQWASQIEEIKNSLEEKEARWLELSEK